MGMYYRAVALEPLKVLDLSSDSTREEVDLLMDQGHAIDLGKDFLEVQQLLGGSLEEGPVFAGRPVGPEGGYGPAHLMTPDLVDELAARYGGVTPAEAKRRFNWDELTFSPIGEDDYEAEYFKEAVVSRVDEFAAFLRSAADRGDVILAQIT
ncbi:MAG: DUF1877 family protein [Actinomycetia bacterium]|nr:DUF1877 family protein [Actinomycetes bacterium]